MSALWHTLLLLAIGQIVRMTFEVGCAKCLLLLLSGSGFGDGKSGDLLGGGFGSDNLLREQGGRVFGDLERLGHVDDVVGFRTRGNGGARVTTRRNLRLALGRSDGRDDG